VSGILEYIYFLLTSVYFLVMSSLLGSSKITARCQITIPDEARRILKVKEGQVVAFVEENGKIVLKTDL